MRGALAFMLLGLLAGGCGTTDAPADEAIHADAAPDDDEPMEADASAELDPPEPALDARIDAALDAAMESVERTHSDASQQADAARASDTGARSGTYSLNFAEAALENPLSAGSVWTNNTQGTGGNVAPGNMTSMQVSLASDGKTRIAFETHAGVSYDDSFAFVPGFTGDQYIEAVIYKEAGYNPNANGSNHELELILGCSSASGSRIWNEFLFNAGGGVDIVYLDGGPSDFMSIANVSGMSGRIPVDGDVVRATRVGNVLSLFLNGVLWTRYNGANPAWVAKGSGIGIAGFIRPGASHGKFGFRRVTMGSL